MQWNPFIHAAFYGFGFGFGFGYGNGNGNGNGNGFMAVWLYRITPFCLTGQTLCQRQDSRIPTAY